MNSSPNPTKHNQHYPFFPPKIIFLTKSIDQTFFECGWKCRTYSYRTRAGHAIVT